MGYTGQGGDIALFIFLLNNLVHFPVYTYIFVGWLFLLFRIVLTLPRVTNSLITGSFFRVVDILMNFRFNNTLHFSSLLGVVIIKMQMDLLLAALNWLDGRQGR